MGSSYFLSFPSEPPDIGRWFSSYAYESPELNTIDDFKDSGDSIVPETEESPKESEQDLDGNIILTRSDDLRLDGKGTSDVANCKNSTRDDNYVSEVLENSESSSLGSEPPDVKKWFSSYVYESPVLDKSFGFRSNHKENVAYQQETDAKHDSKEKEVTSGNSHRTGKDDFDVENIPSDGLAEYVDFVEDTEKEDLYFSEDSQKANGNQNSATLSDLTTQWSLDQTLQKKTMQHQGNGSAKDLVIAGSSLNKSSSEFNPEVSNNLWNNGKRGKLAQGSTLTRDHREESLKAEDFTKGIDSLVSVDNIESNGVDAKPVKKTCGSVDKQNNTVSAEDGFISTRKIRSRQEDKENSFRRPFDVKSDPVKDGIIMSPCSNKEAIVRRNVLLETTNIQPFSAIGVTGKWMCPQKTKPNLGPPLKQLRLEKWFHRV